MSLKKVLEALNNVAPKLPDLEDQYNDDNPTWTTRIDQGEVEPVQRRRIIAPIEEEGKYAGMKVTRCDIFDDRVSEDDDSGSSNSLEDSFEDLEDETEHEVLESEEEETDIEGSISEADLKKTLKNGHSDEYSENEVESVVDENDDEIDDEDEDEDNDDVDDTTASIKNIMLNVDKEKESKKAESVKQQLKQWEQLIYIKIKLQAALRAYNQLPRGQLAKELLKDCDEDTKKNLLQARANAKELVELLLNAEKGLLASSPLTQSIVGIEGGMADSDDEEIESSEDEIDDDAENQEDENQDLSDENEEEHEEKQIVGHSWKAHEKALKENEEKFDKFRSTILIKWDERTRLTGPRRAKDAKKDFSAFEQGNIVAQINKIMTDKVRILKRSQTKRSDQDRIGGNPDEDIDTEIFDDDDFYQVLLKEIIDKKTNASNDPVAMTRHYIEMQNLKNKRTKKRVFDSKLSKDRKIKYIPIPKLVNFHPARPELVTWTHESRNELFKSIFK